MSAGRWRALVALALASGAGAAQGPTPTTPPPQPPASRSSDPPGTASSLFWNARERTATGLGRLEAGDAAGAAGALDTAWQLRPDDPLTALNAGTGRLLAGRPDALPALEAAARAVVETESAGRSGGAGRSSLAPDAFFNLGNARLTGGDPRGAIEAYAETLRRAPRREDAKRNLELALRALEQQRREEQEEQRNQTSSDDAEASDEGGGEGADSRAGEAESEDAERTPSGAEKEQHGSPQEGGESGPQRSGANDGANGARAGDSPTGAEPPPASTETPSPSTDGSPPSSPESAPAGSRRQERLPGFVDQPEMTADQAAALLDAVEDLERQQRRQRALERARRRAEVEKDW